MMTLAFGASLTDDTRVVIYERHMFIVQATGFLMKVVKCRSLISPNLYCRETGKKAPPCYGDKGWWLFSVKSLSLFYFFMNF